MNGEEARQGLPTNTLTPSACDDSSTSGAQLCALIAAAWPDSHDPAKAREHAERIVEWHELQALATIDLSKMRAVALEAVEAELKRRTSIDELVALLRRTEPPKRREKAA